MVGRSDVEGAGKGAGDCNGVRCAAVEVPSSRAATEKWE